MKTALLWIVEFLALVFGLAGILILIGIWAII